MRIPKTHLLKAIRNHCLNCCGDSWNEVKLCTAKKCDLWLYRFGGKSIDNVPELKEKLARLPKFDFNKVFRKESRTVYEKGKTEYTECTVETQTDVGEGNGQGKTGGKKKRSSGTNEARRGSNLGDLRASSNPGSDEDIGTTRCLPGLEKRSAPEEKRNQDAYSAREFFASRMEKVDTK